VDALDAAALRRGLAPVGGGWLVGGGLRDALLGVPVDDADLVVPGDARAAAAALARAHGATRFPLSDRWGSWRVLGGGLPCSVDITPLQGAGIEDDLRRRDFTVNAMALPLAGEGGLVDPHGGRSDLRARVLRATAPDVLAADPVRVMRAARLAVQRGLTVEPGTAVQARAAAALLWRGAPERVRDELYRILRGPRPWRGLEVLDELGALGVVVPQLEDARGMEQNPYHHRDVLGHTLEVVRHGAEILADPAPVFRSHGPALVEELAAPAADDLTRGQVLLLACLLHDMAKPATRAVTPDGRVTFIGHDRLGAAQATDLLTRLRCATRVRETVALCVREHLRLGFLVHRQPLDIRRVDRYLRATAPAEAELLVLTAADRLATDGPRTTPLQITRHLDLVRQVDAARHALRARGPVRPPVPGDALAAHLGRAPGPWLGRLLADLREEQLVRPGMTAARARRFAEEWVRREDGAAG